MFIILVWPIRILRKKFESQRIRRSIAAIIYLLSRCRNTNSSLARGLCRTVDQVIRDRVLVELRFIIDFLLSNNLNVMKINKCKFNCNKESYRPTRRNKSREIDRNFSWTIPFQLPKHRRTHWTAKRKAAINWQMVFIRKVSKSPTRNEQRWFFFLIVLSILIITCFSFGTIDCTFHWINRISIFALLVFHSPIDDSINQSNIESVKFSRETEMRRCIA